MIQTILADDHKLFSHGLTKLLDESLHFKVIEQFARGDSLLESIDQYSAELLLLDIDIPGMNGIEILKRIRLKNTDLKIVMLSMHEENIYSREAFALGANGYLTKSIDSSQLIQLLIRVSQGERIFPAISSFDSKVESQILSRQEVKILRLIASGKTSEEIATLLHISALTVKVHRRNMMKKLKANSSAEMISLGFNKGII